MSDSENEITWPPEYKVRRHKRAKYVRLHTTKKHGLEITVPYRYSLKEIPEILEEYKSWIVKQLVDVDYQEETILPETIQLGALDQTFTIRYLQTNRKRTHIHQCPDNRLVVTGDVSNKETCLKLLTKWAKQQAKNHLPEILQSVSEETGLTYADARVRSQKSQWGNCGSDHVITLNYRLIFLPSYLVRHILVHELCHTKYLDHSKAFWSLVAKYDVAWQENKKALKKGDHFIPAWA